MIRTLLTELKKFLFNSIYLVVILLILFLYYQYIFKRNQLIIKAQIEHQYISDMQMKALLLDNYVSKYVQGAKSMSSRSSIRNKIHEYEHHKISLDSLKAFSQEKYKDGIKAIENVNWARRYIHSKILLEEGNCKLSIIDSLIANSDKNIVNAYLNKTDSTFYTIVISPIYHDHLMIGYDVICFNNNDALNKIKDANINFSLSHNQEETTDKIVYTSSSAICIIKSEYANTFYQFTIAQNVLFNKLNAFYKQQTYITILLLVSLILIIYIFHRKKQLISLQKSEYFELLATQKTEKLKQSVNQLLEVNKLKEESENRFKTIFEDNRSIMLIIDPKSLQIESANNAALNFYGYTEEQIIKLKIYDLNTLPREEVRKEASNVITNNKAYFNFKHKLSSGEIRDVEIYSSPININSNTKLISIIHDITERKLYREKIEKLNSELSVSILNHKLAENKLKTIVDMSPIAIMMSTGIEQKIDYLNPVFIRLFGYQPDEIKSIPDWWSIAITDRELYEKTSHEWNERVRRANINNTKINPIEAEVTCKDGSKRNIRWGYISTGIQNWAFGLDLTELRTTEKHLRRAKQKLEDDAILLKELNATKDKFFRIVAHDLKSPFNAILGFTSTLIEDFNSYTNEEIQRIVKIIDDSARNTYGLLENLLKWSQAQTGKTIYNPNNLIVSEIINKTIQQLSSVAAIKNIQVNYTNVNNQIVYADENMLITVLRNLINNAIKFTHEGGKIEISSVENESHIVFIVKDNGVGIPKDIIDKLFKIEEKISTKGTNNESGTGLGLLLANEFVKKHNGSINVESEPGKGSVFKIQLPLN